MGLAHAKPIRIQIRPRILCCFQINDGERTAASKRTKQEQQDSVQPQSSVGIHWESEEIGESRGEQGLVGDSTNFYTSSSSQEEISN